METQRRAFVSIKACFSLNCVTDLVETMKAVPSVLHYLGKCTAGFSLICVHTCDQ